MEWHHQYVAGGVADQNPMLLRCFDMINRVKSQHEAEKQKREEEKNKSARRPSKGRSPRARRS